MLSLLACLSGEEAESPQRFVFCPLKHLLDPNKKRNAACLSHLFQRALRPGMSSGAGGREEFGSMESVEMIQRALADRAGPI